MEMEDVEPNIFGLLVNWLYTQNRVDNDGSWQGIFDLAKLWTLGGRCLIPRYAKQSDGPNFPYNSHHVQEVHGEIRLCCKDIREPLLSVKPRNLGL
jgi:hypothetical protein